MKVPHNAEVIVGDYQFSDKVKEQVLLSLRFSNPISQDHSNYSLPKTMQKNRYPYDCRMCHPYR